jgi:altronate hydrolase
LTEVPEMFGAEQHLMARARDEKVFGEIVRLVNGFKEYYMGYGQPIDKTPRRQPGGGITTLEEKSLGCIQKGGQMPPSPAPSITVSGARRRPEPADRTRERQRIHYGPGGRRVQIILFTTGRGNPLGTVAPVIKIASNSELTRRKPKWIDFDAEGC